MMPSSRDQARQDTAAIAASKDTSIVLGSGLLSATGSLPLHLMPAIVATLVADHVAPIEQAGWIASAVLLGQMLAALSLPYVGVTTVSRKMTVVVAITFLLGMSSTISHDFPRLLVGWFLTGICCGVLQHLGLTTAAASVRPSLAFALRLGIVMIVAGAAAAGLSIAGALVSYESMTIALIGISGALIVVGLGLYGIGPSPAAPKTEVDHGLPITGLYGLLALMILFAGQIGFMAYVMQGAAGRGLSLPDTLLAVAAIKAAVGTWLVYSSQRNLAISLPRHKLAIGALLALCAFVASDTEQLPVFFLAYLGFELAFNTLAAASQAAVTRASPAFGRSWLTATILIGAAIGPPIHGAVLAWSVLDYFIPCAMASALVPALWAWRQRKWA